MKTDLDSLMQDHNLDAILITGPGQHNPAMYYLTGGAHLTSLLSAGLLIRTSVW